MGGGRLRRLARAAWGGRWPAIFPSGHLRVPAAQRGSCGRPAEQRACACGNTPRGAPPEGSRGAAAKPGPGGAALLSSTVVGKQASPLSTRAPAQRFSLTLKPETTLMRATGLSYKGETRRSAGPWKSPHLTGSTDQVGSVTPTCRAPISDHSARGPPDLGQYPGGLDRPWPHGRPGEWLHAAPAAPWLVGLLRLHEFLCAAACSSAYVCGPKSRSPDSAD